MITTILRNIERTARRLSAHEYQLVFYDIQVSGIEPAWEQVRVGWITSSNRAVWSERMRVVNGDGQDTQDQRLDVTFYNNSHKQQHKVITVMLQGLCSDGTFSKIGTIKVTFPNPLQFTPIEGPRLQQLHLKATSQGASKNGYQVKMYMETHPTTLRGGPNVSKRHTADPNQAATSQETSMIYTSQGLSTDVSSFPEALPSHFKPPKPCKQTPRTSEPAPGLFRATDDETMHSRMNASRTVSDDELDDSSRSSTPSSFLSESQNNLIQTFAPNFCTKRSQRAPNPDTKPPTPALDLSIPNTLPEPLKYAPLPSRRASSHGSDSHRSHRRRTLDFADPDIVSARLDTDHVAEAPGSCTGELREEICSHASYSEEAFIKSMTRIPPSCEAFVMSPNTSPTKPWAPGQSSGTSRTPDTPTLVRENLEVLHSESVHARSEASHSDSQSHTRRSSVHEALSPETPVLVATSSPPTVPAMVESTPAELDSTMSVDPSHISGSNVSMQQSHKPPVCHSFNSSLSYSTSMMSETRSMLARAKAANIHAEGRAASAFAAFGSDTTRSVFLQRSTTCAASHDGSHSPRQRKPSLPTCFQHRSRRSAEHEQLCPTASAPLTHPYVGVPAQRASRGTRMTRKSSPTWDTMTVDGHHDDRRRKALLDTGLKRNSASSIPHTLQSTATLSKVSQRPAWGRPLSREQVRPFRTVSSDTRFISSTPHSYMESRPWRTGPRKSAAQSGTSHSADSRFKSPQQLRTPQQKHKSRSASTNLTTRPSSLPTTNDSHQSVPTSARTSPLDLARAVRTANPQKTVPRMYLPRMSPPSMPQPAWDDNFASYDSSLLPSARQCTATSQPALRKRSLNDALQYTAEAMPRYPSARHELSGMSHRFDLKSASPRTPIRTRRSDAFSTAPLSTSSRRITASSPSFSPSASHMRIGERPSEINMIPPNILADMYSPVEYFDSEDTNRSPEVTPYLNRGLPTFGSPRAQGEILSTSSPGLEPTGSQPSVWSHDEPSIRMGTGHNRLHPDRAANPREPISPTSLRLHDNPMAGTKSLGASSSLLTKTEDQGYNPTYQSGNWQRPIQQQSSDCNSSISNEYAGVVNWSQGAARVGHSTTTVAIPNSPESLVTSEARYGNSVQYDADGESASPAAAPALDQEPVPALDQEPVPLLSGMSDALTSVQHGDTGPLYHEPVAVMEDDDRMRFMLGTARDTAQHSTYRPSTPVMAQNSGVIVYSSSDLDSHAGVAPYQHELVSMLSGDGVTSLMSTSEMDRVEQGETGELSYEPARMPPADVSNTIFTSEHSKSGRLSSMRYSNGPLSTASSDLASQSSASSDEPQHAGTDSRYDYSDPNFAGTNDPHIHSSPDYGESQHPGVGTRYEQPSSLLSQGSADSWRSQHAETESLREQRRDNELSSRYSADSDSVQHAMLDPLHEQPNPALARVNTLPVQSNSIFNRESLPGQEQATGYILSDSSSELYPAEQEGISPHFNQRCFMPPSHNDTSVLSASDRGVGGAYDVSGPVLDRVTQMLAQVSSEFDTPTHTNLLPQPRGLVTVVSGPSDQDSGLYLVQHADSDLYRELVPVLPGDDDISPRSSLDQDTARDWNPATDSIEPVPLLSSSDEHLLESVIPNTLATELDTQPVGEDIPEMSVHGMILTQTVAELLPSPDVLADESGSDELDHCASTTTSSDLHPLRDCSADVSAQPTPSVKETEDSFFPMDTSSPVNIRLHTPSSPSSTFVSSDEPYSPEYTHNRFSPTPPPGEPPPRSPTHSRALATEPSSMIPSPRSPRKLALQSSQSISPLPSLQPTLSGTPSVTPITVSRIPQVMQSPLKSPTSVSTPKINYPPTQLPRSPAASPSPKYNPSVFGRASPHPAALPEFQTTSSSNKSGNDTDSSGEASALPTWSTNLSIAGAMSTLPVSINPSTLRGTDDLPITYSDIPVAYVSEQPTSHDTNVSHTSVPPVNWVPAKEFTDTLSAADDEYSYNLTASVAGLDTLKHSISNDSSDLSSISDDSQLHTQFASLSDDSNLPSDAPKPEYNPPYLPHHSIPSHNNPTLSTPSSSQRVPPLSLRLDSLDTRPQIQSIRTRLIHQGSNSALTSMLSRNTSGTATPNTRTMDKEIDQAVFGWFDSPRVTTDSSGPLPSLQTPPRRPTDSFLARRGSSPGSSSRLREVITDSTMGQSSFGGTPPSGDYPLIDGGLTVASPYTEALPSTRSTSAASSRRHSSSGWPGAGSARTSRTGIVSVAFDSSR